MTRNEKLDEFLKGIGIELLPFQKEILKQIINGNKIYICYPPNVGRKLKGETDNAGSKEIFRE